jgi:hypothetical protein
MADQLFSESAAVGSTEDIPDIFDVLEGGEDEGAVRFLLGFNGEEVSGVGFLSHVDTFGGMEVMDKYVSESLSLGLTGSYLPSLSSADQPHQQQQQQQQTVLPSLTQIKSPVAVRQAHSSLSSSSSSSNSNSSKKRDTSGAKAIHNCDSCGKCFTTKFNLKRHINMHCHKSKENGVPIQGPPSASAPAKKTNDKPLTPSGSSHKSADNAIVAMTSPIMPQPPISTAQIASHQTVLPPSQSLLHTSVAVSEGNPATPYPRSASGHSSPGSGAAVDEFAGGPEPDTTYRLPSVQTLLPVVSSAYNIPTPIVCAGGAGNTYSIMTTSCDSSHVVPVSESSSIHLPSSGTSNTDYGTLPADLFDPDSSKSEPPTTPPTSSKLGQIGQWVERGGGGQEEDEYEDDLSSSTLTLTSIPAGWTKKVCFEGGRLRNKFCSPLGRLFTSYEEISQYFKTFNYSVPVGLFNFDAHFDEEDEESDEEEEEEEEEDDLEDSDEDEDSESTCAKRRKSEILGSEPLSPPPPPGTTPSPPLSSLTA